MSRATAGTGPRDTDRRHRAADGRGQVLGWVLASERLVGSVSREVDVTREPSVGAPVTQGAVEALLAAMRRLFASLPDGEWTDGLDLAWYSAGLGIPRFNGLVVLGARADEGTAAAWLDELVFRGLPHAVLSRPSAPQWVAPLAAAYSLTTIEHEPFMCHLDPAEVGAAPQGSPAQLVIDVVDPADPGEVRTAAQLLAEGFQAPVELLAPLVASEVLALDEMTAYVGRAAGQPCTTGLGALTRGHVGVFNIATPPTDRGRGYGAAVTARVVADGVRAGAHTAYLQSSPMGLGIYQRMGFRTAETWACYYPG